MLLLSGFEVIGYMPIQDSDLSGHITNIPTANLSPFGGVLAVMRDNPSWVCCVCHLYNKHTNETVYIKYIKDSETVSLCEFANNRSKQYKKVLKQPCTSEQFVMFIANYVDSVKRVSEREYHVVFKSHNALYNACEELGAEEGFNNVYEAELLNGDFITMSCNNELPL